ncbi:MAG TPA: VWA domain-containing protein, partial [Candidatus Omnitrophica bacterium]|nr:VWA domain-containing protein [Candidatus Omnitrophota bacterium]
MIKVSYYFDNQTIPKNVSDEEQRFVLLRLQSEVEVPRTKLNLCFVLDKSGSMDGEPIENLKRAVKDVVDLMEEEDRVSVILFDSEARVLISNSPLDRKKEIKNRIEEIDALGGTCIDE